MSLIPLATAAVIKTINYNHYENLSNQLEYQVQPTEFELWSFTPTLINKNRHKLQGD